MPGNIFISYRRSESPKDARALYERLRREFGERHVFIDLEGIEPGEDFVETIERQLQGCQVLVALIGRDWAEAKNERGERRLDDENDFVRIELRTALKRGIRVIPVLIDGCPLPDARRLPEDLRSLVRRHAMSLDFHKFDTDAGRLVAAIRRVFDAKPVPPPAPLREQPIRPRSDPTSSPSPSRPLKASSASPWSALRPDAWLVIAAVVSVLAMLGWFASRSHPGPPQEGTAQSSTRLRDLLQVPDASAVAQSEPSVSVPEPRALSASPSRKRFRDCEEPACPWLIAIDEGSFTMGSPATEAGRDADEGPQHAVRIGYRFAVMETELTRGQFRAFVEATKHDMKGGCGGFGRKGAWTMQGDKNWLKPGFEQTDEHPVVCVSWNDAQVYAQWLSQKTGQRYRLLSEAEWEFAARAATTTRFSFGNDDAYLCTYANVADRTGKVKFPRWATAACADGYVYSAPVRSFMPNHWGLYDMHGNVWEWVQDCRRGDYTDVPADGSSVKEASYCLQRLLRGGAWISGPMSARSAGRDYSSQANRDDSTGLRLARMLP